MHLCIYACVCMVYAAGSAEACSAQRANPGASHMQHLDIHATDGSLPNPLGESTPRYV